MNGQTHLNKSQLRKGTPVAIKLTCEGLPTYGKAALRERSRLDFAAVKQTRQLTSFMEPSD